MTAVVPAPNPRPVPAGNGLPWRCAPALLLWLASAGCSPTQADVQAASHPAGSWLGAHALVGQEDRVAAVLARTPALDTAATGSSLLAFVAGYAANDAAPSDNRRSAWRRLAPADAYRGYQGRFDLGAYLASDVRGGTGHVVEVAKPGVPAGELTLVVVEARNAGRLVGAVHSYPQPGLRLTSAAIATDGPALLLALWWGDGDGLRHHVAPGAGFRVIERFTRLPPHSAVQAVVAVREVPRAGSYRVDWYNAPRQGAILWLLAFAPAGAPAQVQPPAGNQASRAMPSSTR